MTIKMHKCRVAGPCGWCDRWIDPNTDELCYHKSPDLQEPK